MTRPFSKWQLLRGPVSLLVAAGIASFLNPRLAVALLVSGLALLGLGMVIPSLPVWLDRVVQRLATALATAVGTALSVVTWLLTVLPLWLVNQLVRYRPLTSGWATDSTAWTPSTSSRNPEVSTVSFRKPGALAPLMSPWARRRTALRGTAVLVLVALGFGAWQIADGQSSTETPTSANRHTDSPVSAPDHRSIDDPVPFEADPNGAITWNGTDVGFAFEGKAWAADLFVELNRVRQHPDPVLGARNGEVRGRYVNIHDGIRDSWTPPSPEVTVWYFGGSTMYGIGQRDDHTIPSVVAKLAARDHIRIRSVNFGVSGDVNWVETIRLAEALASDRKRPDLIVFYDGSNDFGLGWERVDGGDRDPSHSSRLSLSEAERTALAEQLALQPKLDPVARGALAAELSAAQYRRGVLTARKLADSEDIPVVHFWQPQPFARQQVDADLELYKRLNFDINGLGEATKLYENIRNNSGVKPIDLSKIFDGTRARIYMDGSHTNELGASLVGKAMYRKLKPKLRKL